MLFFVDPLISNTPDTRAAYRKYPVTLFFKLAVPPRRDRRPLRRHVSFDSNRIDQEDVADDEEDGGDDEDDDDRRLVPVSAPPPPRPPPPSLSALDRLRRGFAIRR